jgi:hypothetical protein
VYLTIHIVVLFDEQYNYMYCSSKNVSITFSGFRVLGFIGFQHPKTVIPKTIKKLYSQSRYFVLNTHFLYNTLKFVFSTLNTAPCHNSECRVATRACILLSCDS